MGWGPVGCQPRDVRPPEAPQTDLRSDLPAQPPASAQETITVETAHPNGAPAVFSFYRRENRGRRGARAGPVQGEEREAASSPSGSFSGLPTAPLGPRVLPLPSHFLDVCPSVRSDHLSLLVVTL